LADDLRWDAVGYAGHPIVRTPNLDRWARRGVRFTQSFVNTSICSISRASLLTGQYESSHGVDDFVKPLSPAAMARTYPVLLREAGFRTGFIGKWGVGARDLPEAQFDYWKGFPGQGRYFEEEGGVHLTDRMADDAVEFLDGCKASQPFFLQISFKAPHESDGAKERFFPPAKRFEPLFADLFVEPPPTATPEAFAGLPGFLQESEARIRFERQFGTPELYQKSVKDYFRLVAGIDDAVGRVAEKLRDSGLADRTVVIFTSDNGFCLGDYGLQGKWFPFEPSIRVPLFIYDPRRGENGRDVDAMALTIDVAPTILELAGAPVPAEIQGRSLRPFLDGRTPPDWRKDFFYEHHFHHPQIPQSECVRNGEWKYVRYVDRQPVFEQLFDLVRDPLELENAIDDPDAAGVLGLMRERWRELREAVKRPPLSSS
jgi:arylsulfatase A-like enzyme